MNERELHQRFSAWLNARWIPFLHSRTDRKTTTACGDPDYLLALNGRCLFIEIKVDKNKLSPAQEARIGYLRTAGNRVEVCHSLEECVTATETLLATCAPQTRNPFTGHCTVATTTYKSSDWTDGKPHSDHGVPRVNEGEE